jgi:hypothetical protein
MHERWKLRTLRFLGIRESVYYFKHLDKCIETIIPNDRVAFWFSKKDPKKEPFNLLLAVMHISFSYNTARYHTSRKWQVLDQPQDH